LGNCPAGAGRALGGKLNLVSEKTQAGREAKPVAGNIGALQRYWFESLRSYFPDRHFPAFSIGDAANFKRLVTQRLDGADPQEFIDLICSQWVEIMRNKFPKYRAAPDAPTLGFVYRFVSEFLDALSTIKAGHTLVAKDRQRERQESRVSQRLDYTMAKLADTEKEVSRYGRMLNEERKRANALRFELEQERAAVAIRAKKAELDARVLNPQPPKRLVRVSPVKNQTPAPPQTPLRDIIADIKAYTPPEF
jgi:hypothetical protein